MNGLYIEFVIYAFNYHLNKHYRQRQRDRERGRENIRKHELCTEIQMSNGFCLTFVRI